MTLISKAAALARTVSRLLVVPQARAWLDITRLELFIDGLPTAFDGYRIAQFSDLHLDGMTTTRAHLEDLVASINAQQPDLIAFTGDFVTNGIPFQEDDLITPLRKLEARDAKLAIMGNHDHRAAAGVIERVIAETGMINLNNAVHSIWRDGEGLHFAGVDSLLRHYARLDYVIPQLPDAGTAILLAHEPEFADVSAGIGRFALQLSGHTHGGQICIPVFTRVLVGGYSHRPLKGIMVIGDMLLYVNRGIGRVGLPIRFNCPPELTIITLRTHTPVEA